MSRGRSEGTVVDVVKRGSVGIAMLVVLAVSGCVRVQAPREDPAEWARRAVAPDVVVAREQAERDANLLIAHLPLKATTVASGDTCWIGKRVFWHSDPEQFRCDRDTIYYAPVDGPLLPLLTKIDAAVRAAPLGWFPSTFFQNVQYYFAQRGKSPDGEQLSRPYMAYSVVGPVDGGPDGPTRIGRRLEVIWRDPAFPDPDLPDVNAGPLKPVMTANVVYRIVVPAADLPQLVAAHKNVIAITVRQPYFVVPWPSS